jgi:RND family efflux transporter MFP subunit
MLTFARPLNRPAMAGVVILALAALSGCGDGAKGPGGMQAPQVAVSLPVQKKVQEWDEYTGRFAAVDRVEIRARVSGYLTAINFRDGDIVSKGDPLFVIDPRPYEAVLAGARAQVQAAQSQLILANRELDRARDLRRSQAVSEAVLDERQQQVRAAQAAVTGAEARARSAELDLEFTKVSAPVTGRVSQREVSIGNLVSGGSAQSTLLTTIVSLDPIHFYFDADQSAYLKYVRLSRSGERKSAREAPLPVQVALADEKNFDHPGHMDFVDNALDQSTGTIRGRAIFANPDLLLTPGLFGRLRLIGRGEYLALLLPDSAIGTDQNRRFVYVVGADGKPLYRPVTVGPIIEGMRVVREGLKADEKVVVSGLQRIRPNAPVTPVDAPLAATAAAPATVGGKP